METNKAVNLKNNENDVKIMGKSRYSSLSKIKNLVNRSKKNKDPEIFLEEKSSIEIKNKLPPSEETGYDIHPHGEISNDNFSIYISMETISQIKKHALEDTNRELGGMLVGEVNEYDGKRYINITTSIPAQYTNQSGASVTFTHQTWDQVFRTMDKDYPDKIIVGWYHTHPNFGVFLSGDDLFIHKNFFNQEWLVAFVLDPVKNYSGFFNWKNGEIVKSSGYYSYKTKE